MTDQLALRFAHRPAMGEADFLVTDSNLEAVAWIDRWPGWPAPALTVHGPAGCGKTHLTQVWRARSGASVASAADLAVADVPALVALGGGRVALERPDAGVDERALLHLYNVVAERRGSLLLTAEAPPARWGVGLPDLASRLAAAPAVAVRPPDDTLMAAVLIKLFEDRQIAIGHDVVDFLLLRLERSFAAARALVAASDEAALAARRRITIPLVREVLGRLDAPEE